MQNNWQKKPLSSLCLYLNRGAAPAYTDKEGILVLNQKCVRDQRVDFTLARRTDSKKKPVAADRLVQPLDILINSTGVGTLGRVAQVRAMPEIATVDSHVTLVRPDPKTIDPLYLGLAIRCFESEIEALGEGSTGQTELSRARLGTFAIPMPTSLGEQRAIAHILDTLDEKIEVNREQNNVLETMARALFKAWFVDFEPVRAKVEGRWQRGEFLPGLTKSLYDCFPDRLVETEFGEMPEGWDVMSLAKYSALNPESWTKRTRPEQIRYIDLSGTKWGRVESVANYQANDAPSRAQRVLRPLDTIVGTVRPGNGSYALISDEGLTGSTGFAVLRPVRRECSEFVYLAATSRENIERLSNLADGGAYPAVNPEIVISTQVPGISQELLNQFSQQVGPMLAGIASNERTSRSLSLLRDTLLPKLISGELRVPDVEALIQEHC